MATRRDLHFGLILALTIRGLAVTSYDEMRRVAGLAEELGFDSVWLCDHFLTLAPDAYVEDAGIAGARGPGPRAGVAASMPLLECWTTLAALARDTHRVRLGTSVLCHSYRAPAVLAKMAATLDVISGGRLDLGLGAGWFEQEYRAYGIPFPRIGERIAQLGEGLEIIRRMWTEPHPVFRGRHYAIDGAVCDPPSLQRPHPPLWVGGEGDRIHRLAAQAADGVNVRWWGPERIAGRAAYLDAACRDAGRDPRALERSVTALLVVDRDAGRAAATRERFAGIPAEGHVVGTPEQCAERIREYVEAGVRHFLFTIPDVAASGGLELAAREVLPAVRHQERRRGVHPITAAIQEDHMATDDLRPYLEPTRFIDSDHPDVMARARRLAEGCADDRERLERIYLFVRDMPYDILASFRYLAEGKRRASDVLHAGHAFCMGKASSFVALCRAAGIPARVGFQQLHCPDKPFMSEEVRRLWGDRTLPWHSLGEAYLGGRWLKLDATIDAATASAKGRPYTQEFDGRHDIPTVEGPILKDLESHADYPAAVAEWYETMAREIVQALDRAEAQPRIASDDSLWSGPPPR
jgi:probable F420-dependent oxidoreductase